MNQADSIYLDYAAASPIDEVVLREMEPYFSDRFYNPSSPYDKAVEVRRDLERARSKIASLIGAKSAEIIFTAGATESINLALGSTIGEVIVSAGEHQAVLGAVQQKNPKVVGLRPDGRVEASDVQRAITEQTELISITLANSEIGVIQPISEIAQIIKEERLKRQRAGKKNPIYFHTDATQAAAYLDIHISRLGVDMITLSASKIYGPKQVGLLWLQSMVQLKPLILGGGQERGFRSGTENVAGIIGFAKALELAENRKRTDSEKLGNLRDILELAILKAIPKAVVNGSTKFRLPNFLNLSFPGLDGERLVFMLEAKGILVATGSACSASLGTGSPTLTALGLDQSVIDGSLRISLGRGCSDAKVKQSAKIITETIKEEYKRVGKCV